MANENELLLKLNADAKGVTDEFNRVKKQSEDLEAQLAKAAKVSAVAFAGLTATVALSVAEFEEAEKETRQLTQALQNQGIFTEQLRDAYKSYGEELTKTTGLAGGEITNAQRIVQSYLGEIEVTQSLTNSIADLAAAKGIDLAQAAKILGQEIQSGTGALKKEGLELDDAITKHERYDRVLEFVSQRYADQRNAIGEVTLATRKFQEAVKNNAEDLGERFAPAIATAINFLTDLITPSKENAKVMGDLKAAVVAAGLVVTGLGVVLPVVAQGFLTLRAAAAAFNISLGATRVALLALGIPAIIAAVVFLALNWETASARISLAVKGMVTFVTAAFAGLGTVLKGAFTFDVEKIKEGIAQIGNALVTGWEIASEKIPEITQKTAEKQDAIRRTAADRARAEETAEEENRLNRRRAFATLQEQTIAELHEQELSFNRNLSAQKLAELEKSLLTQRDIEQKIYAEQLAMQIDTNNKRLEEQKRYGLAYAAINAALRSAEVKGFKQGTDELVGLQQSQNATLKTIGKASALTQIAIKTAESAMNIYAGFSTIPIIGPVLGIAGAAGAIAFGIEQAGTVIGAKEGGLLTGGSVGRDSIPMMGAPGELVAPSKNYEEVVTGVQIVRSLKDGALPGSPGFAELAISLKDNLAEWIEVKLVERRNLGISIQEA